MTYNTLAEVPTDKLERWLDILEMMRDGGDFKSFGDFEFFYTAGIPLVADYEGEMPEMDAEIQPVLEELVSRDVVR